MDLETKTSKYAQFHHRDIPLKDQKNYLCNMDYQQLFMIDGGPDGDVTSYNDFPFFEAGKVVTTCFTVDGSKCSQKKKDMVTVQICSMRNNSECLEDEIACVQIDFRMKLISLLYKDKIL
jgi:hypothetical protein